MQRPPHVEDLADDREPVCSDYQLGLPEAAELPERLQKGRGAVQELSCIHPGLIRVLVVRTDVRVVGGVQVKGARSPVHAEEQQAGRPKIGTVARSEMMAPCQADAHRPLRILQTPPNQRTKGHHRA